MRLQAEDHTLGQRELQPGGDRLAPQPGVAFGSVELDQALHLGLGDGGYPGRAIAQRGQALLRLLGAPQRVLAAGQFGLGLRHLLSQVAALVLLARNA